MSEIRAFSDIENELQSTLSCYPLPLFFNEVQNRVEALKQLDSSYLVFLERLNSLPNDFQNQ